MRAFILMACLLQFNLATKSQDSPDFTVTGFSMIGKLKYNLGDMMGMPFTAGNYTSVRGTPYYIDTFNLAVVGLSNGKLYEYDKVKLNLYTNQVHFLTPEGQERIAGEGVVRKLYFFLTEDSSHPVVFSSGYPTGYGYTNNTYFEEMNQGNLQVLRQISRTIANDVGMSSTPMGQHFVDQSIYYVVDQKAKKVVKWKKGKEFLQEFLGPNATIANQVISERNLSCRNYNDAVEVFNYVNSH
jgi:hypothetical protein